MGDMFTKNARREFMEHFEGFSDQIIVMAWAYADCLTRYGVDLSAEWQTVTEQYEALKRAYTQGRMDEASRWRTHETWDEE